uniref:Ig-like domain-containing protein n=1 Tax=Astyanax mexicanus TaxID=7994 RepID=A0A3B1KH15_ASTMX
MAGLFLLHVIFQGILFSGTSAWSVWMPRHIRGLRGSCLVIPCSYDYSAYPPWNPYRVVWYQYVSRGYPVVYDSWDPGSVIQKFRGKTYLYRDPHTRDCSLLIKDLNLAHHGERIYAWVDPENVGWRTYAFYDVTSEIHIESKYFTFLPQFSNNLFGNYGFFFVIDTLLIFIVSASAQTPSLQITGGANIGDTVSVQCSTYHTCPYNKPTISLSGINNKVGTSDKVENRDIGDGKYRITLTRRGVVQAESQGVTCTVTHPGGLSASAFKEHTAKCAIYTASISPDSNTEFLEGVEKAIICSITYMCPQNRPYITWNGGQLPGSMSEERIGTKIVAKSTLKFTAKASDNGKDITCRTEIKGNVQRVKITLKIKRSMFSRDWSFSMPNTIRGVQGSCVVIPCSFSFKNSQPSHVNVKWYKFSASEYPLVYDQSASNIISEFRGKTSLYGSNMGNCSLKIQPLDSQHNQQRLYPWMDAQSITSYHRENYLAITLGLEVTNSIEKPQVDIIGIPKVGEKLTLSCSVIHTCPPTPPELSLSISRGTGHLTHTPQNEGKWKTVKEITWDVQEDDTSVSCTVSYSGTQTAMTEVRLSPSCTFQKPTISPTQDEVMEGIEKTFTCTVQHTCQKQKPSLTWNFENMPASVKTEKMSSTWTTVSTLKLKAARDDHDKTLTCTAQSGGEQSSDSVVLKVKRGMSSLDWTYSMPSKIKGLRGSCLIIPCSFEFKSTMPSNTMVKWYEYSSTTFPLVYAQDGQNVIGKFWGKTELNGSASEGKCSLKIYPLLMEHNRERLYPWMDQKPVETFHSVNHRDSCVELEVTEQAEKPKLSITGVPRVGEQITVSCSIYHTCPWSPPTLKMGAAQQTDRTEHVPKQDGFWETTKHHTFKIKEDDQSITCKATFSGEQTSEAKIDLNAQCIHQDIMIEPELADVTEGVATNFTCNVLHSCMRQIPTITWNYEDMPETVKTKENRVSGYITSSNVQFIASMEDHGKKLVCTAKFPEEEITASVVFQVQKYVPKIVDPFENDTVHVFEADVVPRISALTRSCVVIPCTFDIGSEPVTRLRGLWYDTNGDYVYHTGQTNVMDNFKGRTELLGEPDEKNCTLEIDDVKAHDNGPFCFHAEKGNDKYRFNHSCVFIVMKASPDKPVISGLPEEMEPGKKFSLSCSVTHTCPSHPPTIKWSIKTAKEVVSHMEGSAGQWKTTSTVTFIPTGYENEDDLLCSASFWRGKKQETAIYLPITRYEGLKMETIGYYILAPFFSILLLFILFTVGVVLYRRRVGKEPSDGDTLDKRRSVWARFSRRADGTASWLASAEINAPPRPPRPERRSIWSRFSRRGPEVEYK